MKLTVKLFSIVLCALFFISISCKSKTEPPVNENPNPEFQTYSYKVEGLSDSTISDSIFKMMFQVGGIEEMIMDNSDSIVIFKVHDTFNQPDSLQIELEARGAKIIKKLD